MLGTPRLRIIRVQHEMLCWASYSNTELIKATVAKMLKPAQKKALRAAAHTLKPVVMIGNHGYSEAVGLAIDEALTTHELIKVRLRGVEAEERKAITSKICHDYKAEEIAIIGAIAVLYRKNPDK